MTCEPYSRGVAIAHGGPSVFSIYARLRSMSLIQGGAEFSGSTCWSGLETVLTLIRLQICGQRWKEKLQNSNLRVSQGYNMP